MCGDRPETDTGTSTDTGVEGQEQNEPSSRCVPSTCPLQAQGVVAVMESDNGVLTLEGRKGRKKRKEGRGRGQRGLDGLEGKGQTRRPSQPRGREREGKAGTLEGTTCHCQCSVEVSASASACACAVQFITLG